VTQYRLLPFTVAGPRWLIPTSLLSLKSTDKILAPNFKNIFC
jgi:hypothetical protein